MDADSVKLKEIKQKLKLHVKPTWHEVQWLVRQLECLRASLRENYDFKLDVYASRGVVQWM